ncbi:MAG: alpha/beta hydrolase [Bacteroidetes bacterium]|nr:alpha/beta hydrolase [Bacteroidota bacterium]
MKAYFISGLGADKKAFYKLKLPAGYEVVYLDWITPQPKESLKNYAHRFSHSIEEKEDFILVGLSLGGMIAAEIARIKPPKKLILLSTVSSSIEIPWYFRWAGKAGIHRIIPTGLYKRMTIINHFMGSKSKTDKAIVLSFVKQVDPSFIQWAINAILEWNQHEPLDNSIHIHGSKDRLLPHRYTKASHIIENGRHLMVLNKADSINKILEEVLQ